MKRTEEHLALRRKAESRGRRSEWLAIALLLCKAYRILGRRVRTVAGEIDLVALSPRGTVCFIEVKARSDALEAALSLGARQQARIARAARLFLAQRPQLAERAVRFDVIAVAPGTLPQHHRDAWRDEALR